MFVRTDLSTAQQAVQTGHAVIEAAKAFPLDQLDDHPSLILLEAKSEFHLQEIHLQLAKRKIRCVRFHEDDLDDQLTAISTEPLSNERRKCLSNYRLIRGDVSNAA